MDRAIQEVIASLAPPLAFLQSAGFGAVGRTRLPVRELRERVARARGALGPGAAAAALLGELDSLLGYLAEHDMPQRAAALRRAAELVQRLRAVVDLGAAARPDYLPSQPPVAPALAALAQPVRYLKGIGPSRAGRLGRAGIATVEDLLYHLPFRYEDRRRLRELAAVGHGEEVTALVEVASVREVWLAGRRRRVLEAIARDASAAVALVWFHQLPYFRRRLARGARLIVHGRLEAGRGRVGRRIVHPEIESADDDGAELGKIVPIYERPGGMSAAAMRRIVRATVDAYADQVPSALPAEVAARQRLLDLPRALRHLHDPPPEADVAALASGRTLAHRSLVFDEFFYLQLGLALRRSTIAKGRGIAFSAPGRLAAKLCRLLPFRLTGAQQRAMGEIARDMARPNPMTRLLQGDVGSGKTVVALFAALVAVGSGYQAALMAPTELLAEQHYETVRAWCEELGVKVALLSGEVRGRRRRGLLAALATGGIDLVVGTHALIQREVTFARLGLAIVDEQHRFGVLQRAALAGRGACPDTLVMTATPIPRTLALTLYGDLDVSVLDELPAGRLPVRTRVLPEGERREAYGQVRREVTGGHRAYVVLPLIEESERASLRSATATVRELAGGLLAGLRLGLVHGRMRAETRDEVMRRFRAGEYDVLVSTTVVEVGIDVPEATVMVVEHADRFGLAQLHQLRGRVGRGRAPGTCLLVVSEGAGSEAMARLRTLEKTTDGFRIAEADLELRGPGQFLGTRQAGLPDFRVASLVRDASVLEAARNEAQAYLERDPELTRPESRALREVLEHRWAGRLGLARVG